MNQYFSLIFEFNLFLFFMLILNFNFIHTYFNKYYIFHLLDKILFKFLEFLGALTWFFFYKKIFIEIVYFGLDKNIIWKFNLDLVHLKTAFVLLLLTTENTFGGSP